jgi:CG-1 domain
MLTGAGVAEPLRIVQESVPENIREVLARAKDGWLKNTEVYELLQNYKRYGLKISKDPPLRPPGKPVHPLRGGGRCSPFGTPAQHLLQLGIPRLVTHILRGCKAALAVQVEVRTSTAIRP